MPSGQLPSGQLFNGQSHDGQMKIWTVAQWINKNVDS